MARAFAFAGPVSGSGLLMKTITIAVVALMALSLSSCGRRGPLEVPPPTPEQQARAAKTQSEPTIRLAPNDKPIVFDGSGDDVINAGPDAAVDGEPFLLDPLLN
ncbi:putative small periplasmic lipoprotein [Martelella mediterranea DSM 17316]|uniref:Putative small periplasmic lipoprotein n=2 Tax=Aurantimonadaceae TaxID=255475 RepID=A0A1U9Z1L4_9HYPH|nr:putative small periplasmic lipoprotein [Martelella mediterranea DSM 17316]